MGRPPPAATARRVRAGFRAPPSGPPGAGFRGPPRRFDAFSDAGTVGADEETSGEVKWFNPEKGFGFVILTDGRDAFLHGSVLARAGASTGQPRRRAPQRAAAARARKWLR